MRFVGEVPEETALVLQDALRAPLAVPPFELLWRELGAFPTTGSPKVIWLGPSAAPSIGALARALSARVDRIIGPGERRPHRAHLTVARVRERTPGLDWRAVVGQVHVTPVTSVVDHVTLYESRLSSRGPTYTSLCRLLLE